MSAKTFACAFTSLACVAYGTAHADPAYEQALVRARADAEIPSIKRWFTSVEFDKANTPHAAEAVSLCVKAEGPAGLAGLGVIYHVSVSGRVDKVFTNRASVAATCMAEQFSGLVLPAPPQPVYLKFIEHGAAQ